MRKVAWIAAIAVTGAFVSTGGAQAQVSGKWQVDVAQQPSRAPTDAPAGAVVRRSQFPASGTLDIRTKADSAFATWTPTQPAAAPIEMRGVVTGGKVTLRGEQEGRMNVNGEVSIVLMLLEFDLTPTQLGLQGTIELKTETGARVIGSAAVEAKRAG